jgi:catechol 2,3-dioxygenase-like lactoylglutathione lyase family enzyme
MNLNQITIYTNRPVDTAGFYRLLGLRLIVDSLPRYARLECPDGDATLSVHESDATPAQSAIVLYFECEDLDTEVERLREAGLTFESEPEDKTWLWREAYLRDPAGNRICLFRAGANRKNPPWRVG